MKFSGFLILTLVLSLHGLGSSGKTDTAYINKLNDLAYKLNYEDPEQAKKHAKEALELSRASGYYRGMASSFSNLAIISKNTGEYKEGIRYCDSGIYYNQYLGDTLNIAGIYNTLGTINYYLSKYDSAIYWYGKAGKIYKNSGLKKREAVLINNLALANSELGNYKFALDYYFQALSIQDELNDSSGAALTMANIGIIYYNLGNYKKAMDFYRRSLKIRVEKKDAFGMGQCYSNMGNVYVAEGNYGEAFKYYQKALKIFEEKKDINNAALIYSLLGYYQFVNKNYKAAVEYYNKSLETHLRLNNTSAIGNDKLGLGNAYLKMNRLENAGKYLFESAGYFTESGDVYGLIYAYESLSEYFEKTGNKGKALHYYKLFHHLQDSILNVKSSKRIADAEIQYENEKKESQIALLRKDNEIKELRLQKDKEYNRLLTIVIIVILVFLTTLVWRYREKIRLNKKLKISNELISSQKKKIEEQYQKLQQLDKMKSRFLANISHEFRTPLTLIKGPVEDILKKSKDKLEDDDIKNLHYAKNNLSRLKQLIDQLLESAGMQAGVQKARVGRFKLEPFVSMVVDTFKSAVNGKKEVIFNVDENKSTEIYFDIAKLEIVLYNLLSNADKFTGENGKITIKTVYDKLDEGFVEVSVSDNGMGISEEDLPKIFDRFFRSSDREKNSISGTGIGLELCRDIMELFSGKIEVKSSIGKGSEFTISIRLGKEHLKGDAFIFEETGHPVISAEKFKTGEKDQAKDKNEQETGGQLVLVVEDNDEMRSYIVSLLSKDNQVIEAKDGNQGFEKAVDLQPDIIVSDLMMPGLDGFGLLKKLRADDTTRTIPFILLTARAQDKDILEGYKLKADAYITKPFNSEELTLRVNNIIQTRKLLESKLSKKIISLDINNTDLKDAEMQFLEKMKEAVIENISNPEFGVSGLAGKAFLSERQFRRKLKEITGLSPVEFIRQIRLLKAKELLEKNVYETISEVAVAVGFNNANYFSRLYKNMFGIQPSDSLERT